MVLASADRGDWVLCQVTSQPYGDAHSEPLAAGDFAAGGLRLVSYARPAKLFTAHQSLFTAEVGRLQPQAFQRIRDAVLAVFK